MNTAAQKAMRDYERAFDRLETLAFHLSDERIEATLKLVRIGVDRSEYAGSETVAEAIAGAFRADLPKYAQKALAMARENAAIAAEAVTAAIQRDKGHEIMKSK